MLSLGGARVGNVTVEALNSRDYSFISHLFVDKENKERVAKARDTGIACLDQLYIGDYLMKVKKAEMA